MRIDKSYNNFKINYIQAKYESDIDKKDEVLDKRLKRDSVDISDEGKVLLEKMKNTEIDDQSKRVEEIKKAVNDGTYELDSKKTAARIMDRALAQGQVD